MLGVAASLSFGSIDAALMPDTFELSSVDGNNGLELIEFGYSVSGAGDINGDGVDDLVLGNPVANSGSGVSYVMFGKNTPFSNPIVPATLGATDGFTINGAPVSESGSSVSGAGDINGDGVDDLFVGAPRANSSEGASYVVFGKNTPFDNPINLTTLSAPDGFVINGAPVSESGSSVSGAGDINGDGVDDLFVGGSLPAVVYMPLADPVDLTTSLNLGETVYRSIAPVSTGTDPASPIPDIDSFAFGNFDTTSVQRYLFQTHNDGTKADYDTTLTLHRTGGLILNCQNNGVTGEVASNDNIDTAPDHAYSRLDVVLDCGTYRIDVASRDPGKAIPSYALSMTEKPVKVLPSHQWQLISLPDGSPSPDDMTVEAVFGDDLDPETYFFPAPASGPEQWVMWGLNESQLPVPDYFKIALSDSLEVGKAYWIRQDTGVPVTLDTPAEFEPFLDSCSTDFQKCFFRQATVPAGDANSQWNLMGNQG